MGEAIIIYPTKKETFEKVTEVQRTLTDPEISYATAIDTIDVPKDFSDADSFTLTKEELKPSECELKVEGIKVQEELKKLEKFKADCLL